MNKLSILALTALTAGLVACGPEEGELPETETYPAETDIEQEQAFEAESAAEAEELAMDAAETLRKVQADTELAGLLDQAQGIFVVPTYGQAAAVAGAQAGEGVLLVSEDSAWHGPAFYDLGGVTVGAQVGAEGGEIAMILMSDRAVEDFQQENNFSLTGDAGLTLVDWSERAQAEADSDMDDVIMWSDTEGLFAGVELAVTDINWDDEENAGYYGRAVTPTEVLTGAATGPERNPLTDALDAGN